MGLKLMSPKTPRNEDNHACGVTTRNISDVLLLVVLYDYGHSLPCLLMSECLIPWIFRLHAGRQSSVIDLYTLPYTTNCSCRRPRPPMSESIDSRATSLGVQDPPYAALETEALDKLLFGAVYSLTRVSRQGNLLSYLL